MSKEKSSTLSQSDSSRSQSSSLSNNIYGSDESISISLDNIKISEIISDLYKNMHCKSQININFKSLEDIEIDNFCQNSSNIKIKDFIMSEITEEEMLSEFTCNEHKNEKFNSYCLSCKKNSCPKCHCINKNHTPIILFDCELIKHKIDIIEQKINRRFNFEEVKTKNEIKEIIEKNKSEKDFPFYKLLSIIVNDFKNFPTYEQFQNINNAINFRNYPYVIGEPDIEFNMLYIFNKNNTQLFGREFIENNKDNCYVVINEIIMDLDNIEIFDLFEDNQKNNIFEVKLINKKGKIITNFNGMFYNIPTLLNFSVISNIKNIKPIDISYMFYNCSLLTSINNISNLNISNVTNINHMFYGCSSLKFFHDISNWDTSNVINMSYMFYECSSLLFKYDLTKWNISNVVNMSYMFYNISSLVKHNFIDDWKKNKDINTSNIINENNINNNLILSSNSNIDNNESLLFNINNNESLLSNPNRNNRELILIENNNEESLCVRYKKLIKIIIILLVVISILICVLVILLFKLSKKEDKDNNYDKDYNSDYTDPIIDDIIDDPIILKNDIWDGYETNVGAHYYAYSPYSIEYSKVRGLIQLPDSINTNYGKRNSYISSGILGINGGINIGLINNGTGWRPFHYFIKTQEMFCYNEYRSNNETKFIEIEIEVTHERKLLASFTLRNSTLFPLKTLNFEIDES